MVSKAFVEEVISRYKYRVRIPVIHKSAASTSGTPFNELPIATVCSIPGMDYVLALDDVVYVAYEEDLTSSPVIIGRLSNANPSDSYLSLIQDLDGGSW